MPFPTAFPSAQVEAEFLIAECRRSRASHAYWIRVIEGGTTPKRAIDLVGGLEHHRYHVRKYNALIRILQEYVL